MEAGKRRLAGDTARAAAGTLLEYTSLGGSTALYYATDDAEGLASTAAGAAAGLVPGGRIARRFGGAVADAGRRSNGQFRQNWNGRQNAQDTAFNSAQQAFGSGLNICQ